MYSIQHITCNLLQWQASMFDDGGQYAGTLVSVIVVIGVID